MSMLTSELDLFGAIQLPPADFAHHLLNLFCFLDLALTLLLATYPLALECRKKMNSSTQIVHFRAHSLAALYHFSLFTGLRW
jgi:hypothetical protein